MEARPLVLRMLAQTLPPALQTDDAERQAAESALAAACREGNPICIAVGRVAGLETGQLAGTIVPVLLEILLIVVVAVVVNRLSQRATRRFVRRLEAEGVARIDALRARDPAWHTGPINLARATQRFQTIGGVMRSLATVVIVGFAGVLVLGALGIDLRPLLAGAGIAGVALGFGAQNVVKDVLAGTFALIEDQYGIGDVVTLGESSNPIASGVVEGITLRTTRLRDLEGTVWHVPNGEIRAAGNKSQLYARTLLDVGVAYDTDVARAIEVIKGVADEVWQDPRWAGQVLEEPEVWGVEDFGPSEIVIRLVAKVEPARQFAVNRELRARLLRAFAREGIEIPFPQQVVWTRDGHGAGVTPG